MEEIPKLIIFNNIKYYNYKDLLKYDKLFFRGCNRKGHVIIKLKLRETGVSNYIYTTTNNKVLVESDENNIKSKLLITESWCLNNFPKLIIDNY
jgi:hypothetical protein